jgi:hypothetical protein
VTANHSPPAPELRDGTGPKLPGLTVEEESAIPYRPCTEALDGKAGISAATITDPSLARAIGVPKSEGAFSFYAFVARSDDLGAHDNVTRPPAASTAINSKSDQALLG